MTTAGMSIEHESENSKFKKKESEQIISQMSAKKQTKKQKAESKCPLACWPSTLCIVHTRIITIPSLSSDLHYLPSD